VQESDDGDPKSFLPNLAPPRQPYPPERLPPELNCWVGGLSLVLPLRLLGPLRAEPGREPEQFGIGLHLQLASQTRGMDSRVLKRSAGISRRDQAPHIAERDAGAVGVVGCEVMPPQRCILNVSLPLRPFREALQRLCVAAGEPIPLRIHPALELGCAFSKKPCMNAPAFGEECCSSFGRPARVRSSAPLHRATGAGVKVLAADAASHTS
jgi:hypothetical protein